MSLKKRVRIIKKIQEGGNWEFIPGPGSAGTVECARLP